MAAEAKDELLVTFFDKGFGQNPRAGGGENESLISKEYESINVNRSTDFTTETLLQKSSQHQKAVGGAFRDNPRRSIEFDEKNSL